jgi:NUMOD1 domain
MRKLDPNKGLFVLIEDVTTGKKKKYKSIREAARDLKADTRSIRSRIPNEEGKWVKSWNSNESLLFRNKYKITLISNNNDEI